MIIFLGYGEQHRIEGYFRRKIDVDFDTCKLGVDGIFVFINMPTTKVVKNMG